MGKSVGLAGCTIETESRFLGTFGVPDWGVVTRRSRMGSDGEGVVLAHVGRSTKDQMELDRQPKVL